MIGQIIANYEVKSLLGAGGMGTVYLAEHVKLGRQVAIKSLHAQFVNSEEIRTRFIHEAKVMAQLQHPNIVTLYDYVETETGLFLIIELVDGKPIDDYIKQVSGPIEEGKAIEMMHDILEGFQYAHEKGLVHRDIKPSNLVVADKNKVKILDFGIAKLVGDTSSKMTKTGTHIGTVYYMSPEQVKGDDLDQRSDIYALGVTFFQMLTGSSPYKGMTKEFDVFMKIVNEDLPDPRAIYPGVSEHMCAVLQKATARDVNARFQSCDEFAAALKHGFAIAADHQEITEKTDDLQSLKDYEESEPVTESLAGIVANQFVDNTEIEVEPSKIEKDAIPLDVKTKNTAPKNKFYAVIGAVAVLLGLIIYLLIPSQKATIPIVKVEKEAIETSVIPITEAEQEVFDQLSKIRQRILKGESFDSMAHKYSRDTMALLSSKGQKILYSEANFQYLPEIKKMVEKLKIDEISPIFETQYGYNIIKVLEKGSSNYHYQLILLDIKSISNLESKEPVNKMISSNGEIKSTEAPQINSKENEYFLYSFINPCYEIFPYKFYIDNKRYYYNNSVSLKAGKHKVREILYIDGEVFEEEKVVYLSRKNSSINIELNCTPMNSDPEPAPVYQQSTDKLF
jgi:serine/threonine protein kinase